jgi:hypothetical protein
MVRLDPLDEDMEQTPPQTEDAKERGFIKKRQDEQLGRTNSIDPDDSGDIADEGPGHRG